MGRWLSQLNVSESGRFRYRLIDALIYEIAGSVIITVPRGFEPDFASVPRLLWPLVPPHGRSRKAAVVHDYLYSRPDIPRVIADAVFAAALHLSMLA